MAKSKQDKPELYGAPPTAEEYKARAKEHSNITPRHEDEPTYQAPIFPAEFEVRLLDGTRVYGTISYVDHEEETFYILDRNQLGMFGKKDDGRAVSFSECSGVFSMTSPGVYGSQNQIEIWERWFRTSKL